MYVKFSQYGERYLRHKDFLNLCSDLEIKLLGSSIDEKWLEYLEKQKILFPNFRVVKPIWYLNYLLKYNAEQQKKIKSKKWIDAKNFYHKIENWSFSDGLFHPFDNRSFESPYLEKPQTLKFRKWKTYFKKPVSDDEEYIVERDTQYYPYWRAYHIYEINKVCSQKYVINAFDEKIFLQYLKHHRAHLRKPKQWTVPSSPEVLINKIFEKDEDFNCLSFYVQSVRRAELEPLHIYRQKIRTEGYNWEEDYERTELRKKRIAKITISKFGTSLDNSISFLQYLCKKYFDYEENNLIKLSYMLRYDIYYLAKLMSTGFDILHIEIEDKIKKMLVSRYKNPLRFILLGEIAKAREDALKIFKDYLSTAFKINKLDIVEEEFENFLEFLDENGMNIIYLTLKKSYFRPNDYKILFNPFDNLSSLVIYFESYLITLISKQTNLVSKDFFIKDKKNLRDFITQLFKHEKWFGVLGGEWKKPDYQKVTTQDINMLEKKIMHDSFHANKKWDEIIKTFLLIVVIRNYVAHDYFKVKITIEHEHNFISNIVCAMWLSWLKANNKI